MNVKEKLQALDDIMIEVETLYRQLQEECPHDEMTAKYNGYSCPYDGDAYWVDIKCPTCKLSKHISSELSDGSRNPEYYKYTHLNKR
ncbi:hypothetical protein vBPpSSYP_211 [Pseudomonas phage vB_PpS_SYP]|nr:hypothetical protein vBPpSSYP_211 [Pseudomonas phage vB_PpS_SYP]